MPAKEWIADIVRQVGEEPTSPSFLHYPYIGFQKKVWSRLKVGPSCPRVWITGVIPISGWWLIPDTVKLAPRLATTAGISSQD